MRVWAARSVTPTESRHEGLEQRAHRQGEQRLDGERARFGTAAVEQYLELADGPTLIASARLPKRLAKGAPVREVDPAPDRATRFRVVPSHKQAVA